MFGGSTSERYLCGFCGLEKSGFFSTLKSVLLGGVQVITLSERAVAKIKEIMTAQNLPTNEQNLRIKVLGGGCSGFQYGLGFDEIKPKDKVWEQEGLKIICDPKSLIYITGSRIDYVESLMGSGFTFENPNAKGTCGCGSSFQA